MWYLGVSSSNWYALVTRDAQSPNPKNFFISQDPTASAWEHLSLWNVVPTPGQYQQWATSPYQHSNYSSLCKHLPNFPLRTPRKISSLSLVLTAIMTKLSFWNEQKLQAIFAAWKKAWPLAWGRVGETGWYRESKHDSLFSCLLRWHTLQKIANIVSLQFHKWKQIADWWGPIVTRRGSAG